MIDKSTDNTGIVGSRPGSPMQGLVENRLIFQVKSLNVAPPAETDLVPAGVGYDVAILVRFAPKTPWQWLSDVVARPEEVVLYFSEIIDAHIANAPDDTAILEQWKLDLFRFASCPENGYTQFGKNIA